MVNSYHDPSPEYWHDYSNLQHVKHSLIREYLNGWFPKLGYWAGRILYIDTHAGRGRHDTGQLGSPLIALKTFLEHKHRDRILTNSEARFFFVERDQANLDRLMVELATFGQLPLRVAVDAYVGDCEELLLHTVKELRDAGRKLAPAFVFVDPYGFNVQYAVLRELMSFGRVELFINVMWRHLDMAISQANTKAGMASMLNHIFDGCDWKSRITSPDYNKRTEQTLELIRDKIGAQWMTSVHMLGRNNATKYALVHLTNHEAGRDLMKEAMWKLCPVGADVFIARQAENPTQGVLLEREPNLAPLEHWVLDMLRNGPVRWQTLDVHIRSGPWLQKHLNSVVRDLRDRSAIMAENHEGRFSHKANPLLSLKVIE